MQLCLEGLCKIEVRGESTGNGRSGAMTFMTEISPTCCHIITMWAPKQVHFQESLSSTLECTYLVTVQCHSCSMGREVFHVHVHCLAGEKKWQYREWHCILAVCLYQDGKVGLGCLEFRNIPFCKYSMWDLLSAMHNKNYLGVIIKYCLFILWYLL